MKRFMCAVLLCILLTGRSAHASDSPLIRYTTGYFGTVSVLCVYGEEGTDALWRDVKDMLRTIDESVSVSRPDSDIARFNALPAGSSIVVSACTAEIWRRAREAYALTGGLYDPTVFPLVDLWGFSPRFNQNVYSPSLPYDRPLENGYPAPPNAEDIQALLSLVGMEGITLNQENENWILHKNTPDICMAGTMLPAQIDLGGIAKGYACDQVAALLRERGVTSGYFICGGSSMVFFSRLDGSAFSVAAGKPRTGRNTGTDYASFSARNTTVSTSSDISHGYWGADGKLYCHIIDPRTGYPLNVLEGSVQAGASSVSLMGDSAALGDALTTALCLMGPRKALAFLNGREEKMVMAVYSSEEEYFEIVTNLPQEDITILDDAYLLKSKTNTDRHFHYIGTFDSEE